MAQESDRDKEKIEEITQGVKRNYTRRDFLKTAGVAAGLGAVSTLGIQQLIQQNNNSNTSNRNPNNPTGAATGGQDYETIEVSAGDTFRKSLSDGETWENKLIDISANGASYDIQARDVNSATIRNIGIRGHIDDSSGNQDPFRLRANSGGTITVENICFETTCSSTESDPSEHHGATGIYVWRGHAGHIEINGAYIQNFPDNGVYASSPGHEASNAGGGTIQINNSYVKDCNTSCFRLGTTGSGLDNCVGVGNSHRGIWVFYEHPEVNNTDIVDCTSDIALGSSDYEKSYDAEVTMTNSRWNTETAHGNASTSNIHGSSQGQPQDRIPEGCPTTAVEAASGAASGGSTGTGGTGSTDPLQDIDTSPGEHAITLKGGSQNDPKNYIIEAENLEKQQGNGKILGNTATGTLTGQTTHKYRYNGHIHDIRLQKGITITYDSKQLTQPQITALCQNPKTGSGETGTGGDTTCTETEDFEIIAVAAGDTFTKNLSDGETWENKIIDITASGAGYQISAHADGFEMRNIGVRGEWDHEPSSSPFTVRVPSSSSTGVIENVYLGDGSVGHVDDGWSNPTGIYVHPDHAGTLEIHKVNIQRMPDNGIYGSEPGHVNTSLHAPAKEGEIHVYDSYIKDCTMNFRLGSEGSFCKNCISVHSGNYQVHSGFRDYFGNGLRFENCDSTAPGGYGFNSGSSTWVDSGPYSCSSGGTRLINCRADASTSAGGPCSFDGTPSSNPRTDPADVGAPTSAREAASCGNQ